MKKGLLHLAPQNTEAHNSPTQRAELAMASGGLWSSDRGYVALSHTWQNGAKAPEMCHGNV